MESSPPQSGSPPVPGELCGYVVDCALPGGASYLAIGPGGRGIVLKKLDDDCLLRGVLHPSIRERLSRIRELAHGGIANLHGVGRDGDQAYLIWEFVPGLTLEEWSANQQRSTRELAILARELILTVGALHAQGIVHGAVTGSNVIVEPAGTMRLTHVSPLLYQDPMADVESVVSLLQDVVEARGEDDSPLARLLEEAARDEMPLAVLGSRLAALAEEREHDPPAQTRAAADRQVRRRTLWLAAVVALLGLALGYAVWRAVEGGVSLDNAWRWLSR